MTTAPGDFRLSRDFVELQQDVSGSPLWNPDLAPTTIKERTWSTWNIAALWIGMSVVITTYTLAGGFIEAGMSWWQAMVTILLGNTIVLIPMVLNAHAGTKYGVSFPVLCRAAFGTSGANVPAILRAIVACGWFGIQTWIGGQAIDALFGVMWTGWNGIPGHVWVAFFSFWGIQVWIILKGVEGIKHLETWSAPLLLGGGLLLLVWASNRAGGLGRVLAESAALQKQNNAFWSIFPGALTASVGYWATLSLNIPDFTRYARSQRSQMLGQALGLPLTMTAFAFIGVAVTSATLLIYGQAIPNPVDLMTRFDSVLIIAFATAVIFAAQITTNMAANVVSPSNDFSNLNPKAISYVTGGLITSVIGVLMMPWNLMESMGDYIFTWLIGYSGLMGAIAGILICDYWFVRKQTLDLPALFDPMGKYSYSNGVNWRAMISLVIAIAPVVPGFLRAATTPGGQVAMPTILDTLYTYAWFVTFGLGFVLYWLLADREGKWGLNCRSASDLNRAAAAECSPGREPGGFGRYRVSAVGAKDSHRLFRSYGAGSPDNTDPGLNARGYILPPLRSSIRMRLSPRYCLLGLDTSGRKPHFSVKESVFMPRIVRCGLIQATCSTPSEEPLEKIKRDAIDKHLKLLDQAASKGAKIVCMQEIFTGPYFCAEQSSRWYGMVEKIPEGPTIQLMQEIAKKYGMALIVPIYEEDLKGVYYNTAAVVDADGSYLGKYRKHHIPHCAPGFWEKFYFKPGNLGYPVFKTQFADIGVYICYDRHFPEGARALGLNGAEVVFNPSATVAGLSEYLWKLEQPAHAVANGYFVGAINRVGREHPWNIGEFYGQSYFCTPRGKIIAEGSRDKEEVIVADLNLDEIQEVRNVWQFFRDRRPESYGDLVKE